MEDHGFIELEQRKAFLIKFCLLFFLRLKNGCNKFQTGVILKNKKKQLMRAA